MSQPRPTAYRQRLIAGQRTKGVSQPEVQVNPAGALERRRKRENRPKAIVLGASISGVADVQAGCWGAPGGTAEIVGRVGQAGAATAHPRAVPAAAMRSS